MVSGGDAVQDVTYIPTEEQPDRNLVVLLLDTSGSMGSAEEQGGITKISQLTTALEEFLETGMHVDSLLDGGVNRLQVNGEIAIGAFREEVQGHQEVRWLKLASYPVQAGSPFYYVQDVVGLSPEARSELQAKGGTPMAEALHEALDVIEARKDGLLTDGLTHECRPNMFLLTDGAASSPIYDVAERLHREEADNRVLFWAFGTPKCARNQLLTLADKGPNCIFLDKRPIASVLAFVNKSMRHQQGSPEMSAREHYESADQYMDDTEMHPE